MKTMRQEVLDLVKSLPLGEGHEMQESAVAAALSAFLGDAQRGVVLADEVGFGKTYEALAVMALLMKHAHSSGTPFERVLILCKPALLRKWSDEVSTARAKENIGFPQYLQGRQWDTVREFLKQAYVIGVRHKADELRKGGMRGTRLGGTVQVPPGLYIANHDVLGAKARDSRPLLKQLYKTRWDLIIVDEAHHYAKGNRPVRLFAPDENLRNYEQGFGDGEIRRILALTATPFELTPREIVRLLALIRAEPADIDAIDKALVCFVQELDKFFDRRQRSPADALRRAHVAKLKQIRIGSSTNHGSNQGLQPLLRKYLIRNCKSEQERKYFLVNKVVDIPKRKSSKSDTGSSSLELSEFHKLEDLAPRLNAAPLLPFDGADALFYLQLRRVIQETVEGSEAEEIHRTFITADLRQGLSSYPQIAASALLQRKLESAKQLKRVLDRWNQGSSPRLHPKVLALKELVRQIALAEVAKIRRDPTIWISKILVFNKLIKGTAVQLHQELAGTLVPIFDEALHEQLQVRGLGSRQELEGRLRRCIDEENRRFERKFVECYGPAAHVPRGFSDKAYEKFTGRPFLDVFKEQLRKRCGQSLLLLNVVVHGAAADDRALKAWVKQNLLTGLYRALNRIASEVGQPRRTDDLASDGALGRAERDAVTLLDDYRSVHIVGRFDGDDIEHREARRRNFNLPYNPFVLLVSRVGEEGIDLQKQCRYVIHYDLEWNPAKMEQREGRVDRVGWGRTKEKFIDVRFLLLKGTYEERIFHTVMQRDQWFQILIGSKRKKLGRIDPNDGEDFDGDEAQESFEEVGERGKLTTEECRAIMLDLAPRSEE